MYLSPDGSHSIGGARSPGIMHVSLMIQKSMSSITLRELESRGTTLTVLSTRYLPGRLLPLFDVTSRSEGATLR